MRPLLIDQSVRERIAQLVAFAQANPVDAARLDRMLRGSEPMAGGDPRHQMLIPFGFRVVFSIEELPNGLARHFSISVPEPGRLPSPVDVRELLPLFGMADFERSAVWVEGDPRAWGAINVLSADGGISGQPGRFPALPPDADGVRGEHYCVACRRRFVAGDSTGVFRAGEGIPGPGRGVAIGIAHFDCLQASEGGAAPKSFSHD